MCEIDNNKDYAVKVTNLTKIYKIYKKPWHRILNIFKKVNYREFYALDNVSVTFPKGEAIGILGVNGSGKSTLLKMITGVTIPSEGEIEVNGMISAMLELTSGFDKELTGLENIHLKAVSTGIPEEVIEEKIDEIAEFADIGDYLYQPVRTYSSGMKARLGFAINVNVDPDILIVDEVLAVGDATFQIKCLSKMEEFRKRGKTILFVSHNLSTVEGFCTKAMWIKEGKLQEYGETGIVVQIYQDYLKERRKAQRIKQLESENEATILEKKDIVSFPQFKMMNLSINNKRRNVFKYGDTITIRVKYEVKVETNDLTCAFLIRDNEGNEVYSSDKSFVGNRINSEIGVHEFEIILNDVKLLPGTYKFSGALWNNEAGMPIWFAGKRPIIIENDEFVGTGIVKLDYSINQVEIKDENNKK